MIEILNDDPTAGIYLQVGQELLRRRRWDEAVQILERGTAGGGTARAYAMLARACFEAGLDQQAMGALERVERDPWRAPDNARLFVLVLERLGRVAHAKARAEAFLAMDPADVVMQAALERLSAPPPDQAQRGADPFYTVQRAERYAEIGRVDRAIRAYRRILLYHPDSPGIVTRIRQLSAASFSAEDDLSEELTDPGLVPPEPLDMPSPTLGEPLPLPRRSGASGYMDPEDEDVEDEDTEIMPSVDDEEPPPDRSSWR